MNKIICLLILLAVFMTAKADHITGGEMYYSYAGFVNGKHNYNVTLKFFMRCNSGRQFNNPTIISVFDKASSERVMDISATLTSQETISVTNTNPCISEPPIVCYDVGFYNFTVSVAPSTKGYVISSQVNFRVSGITNLAGNQIGASYIGEIPGTDPMSTGPVNASAHFVGSDLVIVCANNSFSYSFAASDADGDELRYTFCDAYTSSTGNGGPNASPPGPPPYSSVPYGNGYSGTAPLGNQVEIDPLTGLITGIAPPEGKYVITVCVSEVRGGQVIATQRKDLQINVADCQIASASLLPQYSLCRQSMTITLTNLSTSPLINTTNWEIRNAGNAIIYSTATPILTYTFTDTGSYAVRLAINRGGQCTDSTESIIRVYPGFLPSFDFAGVCILNATQFTDRTTSVFGTVNLWAWDFGEPTTQSDTSFRRNPQYNFPAAGNYLVRLTVGNSKGCIDTALRTISIVDKPPIQLAFKDTLICIPDRVTLGASGIGNFSWSPAATLVNAGTPSPTASPVVTTTYYVDLEESGCRNRDSVKVRVVDHVSLTAMNDTTVCTSDQFRMQIESDGLRYAWTPAIQCDDPTLVDPIVTTGSLTTYRVRANIGSCQALADVVVRTVPYPVANAGLDTTICFNTNAFLHGKTDGQNWSWSPALNVSNALLLDASAKPARTTAFVLTAFDVRGCPKPGRDTVLVTVLPDIVPFAGNDTTVVVSQPLQFKATGGVKYSWSPAINLSNTGIANPVGIFRSPAAALQYRVLVYNEAGCVDSAFVKVKVFNTKASVFVPNAFTPNNDRNNDVLKPILAGISRLEYFHVYNRWGKLVFSSANEGIGWNGTDGGKELSTGTFVWILKATDYNGGSIINKGTVVLIR
ncbi:MAG: gliding motility-associated C-terminal domain-containing protein [Gemmatimonadaceae bacterium]|nr:gliding motility-associated C-terminal domain-containing protein [Chitinophagaceae bacterium]